MTGKRPRGRPRGWRKAHGAKRKSLVVRMPEALHAWVVAEAARTGLSESAVVRRCVEIQMPAAPDAGRRDDAT